MAIPLRSIATSELFDRSDRYALRPIVRRMSCAPLGLTAEAHKRSAYQAQWSRLSLYNYELTVGNLFGSGLSRLGKTHNQEN